MWAAPIPGNVAESELTKTGGWRAISSLSFFIKRVDEVINEEEAE